MKIDDQTWNDLLLGQYCELVGAGASIFGREALARRLREGADNAASRERVQSLMADDALQAAASAACRPLSECHAQVAEVETDAPPRWARHVWLLPAAFLLSAVLGLLWWPVWVITLACWLTLMALQVSYHGRMQAWQGVVLSLQRQLGAHAALAAIPSIHLDAFRPDADAADRLRRKLARSVLSRLPMVCEYCDWVLLENLKHFFATQRLVAAHIEALGASYRLVAGMEADLALSRHLRHADTFCWAEAGGEIRLQQAIHPLLPAPQPLTIALHGGAFISGQNGAGKSTLLRTVGINLLTARAFGFCYAAQACVPMLAVCASMKSEDALQQGESLYLAELRRAKEMLALASSGQRIVFLIDEIFRGTNHLESVSAGAAVLQQLAARGTVLVSSHNLVLGTLLSDRLTPLCVTVGDGGRQGIEAGILRETNGIALLAGSGFDPAIEARAQEVYAWLSDRLAVSP